MPEIAKTLKEDVARIVRRGLSASPRARWLDPCEFARNSRPLEL